MNVFLDSYLNNNLGDDLMIDMLCERYPQHHFFIANSNRLTHFAINRGNLHVIDPIYPTENQIFLRIVNKVLSYFKIPKLQLLKFKRSHYDALLIMGGSIFKQITPKSWINKVVDGKYLVKQVKKCVVINCNFGPFQTAEFLEEHRILMQKYNYVTFRDFYSYELFKELPNVRYYPDMVFSKNIINNSKGIIGISVISKDNRGINGYSDMYVKNMASLVTELCKKHSVRLYSFCVNEGDTQTCEEIIQAANCSDVKIVEHVELYKTMNSISELSGFVCTRFHSNVIALRMHIPFLPIIYERKTDDMLNDVGYTGYRWYIKNGETVDLVKALDELKKPVLYCNDYINNAQGHFEVLDRIFRVEERG